MQITCPICRLFGSIPGLAAIMAFTVVPNLWAMEKSVSPGLTVYKVPPGQGTKSGNRNADHLTRDQVIGIDAGLAAIIALTVVPNLERY